MTGHMGLRTYSPTSQSEPTSLHPPTTILQFPPQQPSQIYIFLHPNSRVRSIHQLQPLPEEFREFSRLTSSVAATFPIKIGSSSRIGLPKFDVDQTLFHPLSLWCFKIKNNIPRLRHLKSQWRDHRLACLQNQPLRRSHKSARERLPSPENAPKSPPQFRLKTCSQLSRLELLPR